MGDGVQSPTVIFRQGRPPADGDRPPPGYRRSVEDGMAVERDVAIVLRDGATVYADVYRPHNARERLPALLAWGPYGKHTGTSRYSFYPDRAGVRDEWLSEHAIFEGPAPSYWCMHGYAVIVADSRGSWCSDGELHIGGPVEAESAYDAIEWAAQAPWCSGRIGMTGVSYLAIIQWLAASLGPPHLTAINPWEGWTDTYREAFAHGGIRETGWSPQWNQRLFAKGRVEDVAAMIERHPLMCTYWEEKVPALERIEVPAFVVASWTDQGLHTRGTLEAFARLGSEQKWLDVHGRKKWAQYHRPESVDYVRRFFDRFLKGERNGWERRPAVRLEIRGAALTRSAPAWPVPGTRLRPLYLDACSGALVRTPPAEEAHVRYQPEERVGFELIFDEDTELAGSMEVRLWVQADGGKDMDLFVAIEKRDAEGDFVGFPFSSAWDDGPVALGWLRASHRELDQARSIPGRPWHRHARELALPTEQPTCVRIEVWPSGTLFRARERLRLVVSGTDIHAPLHKHADLRNAGAHIIWSGGRYDSQLLVPVTGLARSDSVVSGATVRIGTDAAAGAAG
jgi:predicted acyl esterase